MADILQREHPVLRATAEMLPEMDFGSARLRKILNDMRAALESREDGIAIAAPQIGVPLRIFIVSPRAFERSRRHTASTEDETHGRPADESHRVFINPEILKVSKEKHWLEEGCLSVNRTYGRTKRAKKVSIRARDEKGKVFTMTGNALLSQIFQHEIDHLNGILFSDHAKDLHVSGEEPRDTDA